MFGETEQTVVMPPKTLPRFDLCQGCPQCGCREHKMTCEKCGHRQMSLTVNFTGAGDKLTDRMSMHCERCGYSWELLPREAVQA